MLPLISFLGMDLLSFIAIDPKLSLMIDSPKFNVSSYFTMLSLVLLIFKRNLGDAGLTIF
jgi:hypothetical protein